jgi:hypothetical protein
LDNYRPGSDFPTLHKAIGDIGVFAYECLNRFFAGASEDQECPIGRIGEGTAQDEVTSTVRLPGQVQMFFAKRGSLLYIIVHNIINKDKIVHNISSQGIALNAESHVSLRFPSVEEESF